MKEIYSLSIHLIRPKDQVRVICEEECTELADYLVNEGRKEKYLCKDHLHIWVKKKTNQYHIQQEQVITS